MRLETRTKKKFSDRFKILDRFSPWIPSQKTPVKGPTEGSANSANQVKPDRFKAWITWFSWQRRTEVSEKIVILCGLKLRRLTQNQINLHSKASQNKRTIISRNEAYFYGEMTTHFCATYAIMNFYQNFQNRIPRETDQNFYIMKFSISH